MTKDKKRLGEMLTEAGLIDEFQLSSALGEQKQWGGRLASIIINMGFTDEKSVASILEKQLGEKYVSLENTEILPEVLSKMKVDMAEKYCVMPIEFSNKELILAMSDPTDLDTIDELSFTLSVKIKPVLALESGIKKAIAKHYRGIISEGKKHKVDTKKLSEEMQVMSHEKTEPERLFSPDTLIQILIEVLLEKGVITKEDLHEKIRKKQKHS